MTGSFTKHENSNSPKEVANIQPYNRERKYDGLFMELYTITNNSTYNQTGSL